MIPKKDQHKEEKSLHPRNRHKGSYDFEKLIISNTELSKFVRKNAYNNDTIDFSNPKAVKALNKALLKYYYNIDYWDIPKNHLCPPIPGRADYIHYIADLLASDNNEEIPRGDKIKCLDIGVGANCIYPIIGFNEYEWKFVGSEIDSISLDSAKKIIEANSNIKNNIEIRLQKNPKNIFSGIIKKDEHFNITICNPPFHASQAEAQASSLRKLKRLNKKKNVNLKLNFGGENKELWCDGGEKKFVSEMIYQSTKFAKSCLWFSSLISKKANLDRIYKCLENAKVSQVETIEMSQGHKVSRIVAWTYFSKEERSLNKI